MCDPETGCLNPQVPDADQVTCNDSNSCTSSDVCVAGQCAGTPIANCCASDTDCPADDACTIRYCDSDNTCREADISGQCSAGACEVAFCDPVNGCGTTPTTCPDDGDICTIAVCDPNNLACGPQGACMTEVNPNPPEPFVELTCDDGLDNDCDGALDCDDTDCAFDQACSSPNQVCGNGIVEGSEQCDDGNTLNGDGCSSNCLQSELCNPLDPAPVCGPDARCIPDTDVIPFCESGTGSLGHASACNSNSECLPTYTCNQGFCLELCAVNPTVGDPLCSNGVCTPFATPLFVDSKEFGECL